MGFFVWEQGCSVAVHQSAVYLCLYQTPLGRTSDTTKCWWKKWLTVTGRDGPALTVFLQTAVMCVCGCTVVFQCVAVPALASPYCSFVTDDNMLFSPIHTVHIQCMFWSKIKSITHWSVLLWLLCLWTLRLVFVLWKLLFLWKLGAQYIQEGLWKIHNSCTHRPIVLCMAALLVLQQWIYDTSLLINTVTMDQMTMCYLEM